MEESTSPHPMNRPRSPLRLLGCSGSLDGGGSERQLWQLVSRLDRQRFQPEVYLMHRRGPYLQQLPADVPVHAFDDVYPAPPRWPPGRTSWLQARHLRHVIRTHDIDVVYDRTFHMSLLTSWAVPAHVPRVSVIVSPPSRDFLASERRFVWFKQRLLARAYTTAALTLCVSQEVADDAASFYRLPRQRFTVLPNPIDTLFVRQRAQQALPDTARSLACPRSDQFHIAIVGRFTAEKGHEFALEVARQLSLSPQSQQPPQPSTSNQPTTQTSLPPETHLHFVGDGPLKSTLQSIIDRYALTSRVHLHGYQTNPYPIMAHAQMVFVPSQYEGFPNVALEAMALGVPLLMNDYGPTAQYLAGSNQQRAALVSPGNVSQAVAAIRDCQIDGDAWLARSEAGCSWVEREHALSPWLEQMMSLMERVKR